MRRLLPVLLAVLSAASAAVLVQTAPFETKLGYTVELPDNYDSTRAWPMVVALHGYGDMMSSYVGTAARLCPEGAIGLYPESPYPFEREDGIGWSWWFWGDSASGLTHQATRQASIDWVLASMNLVKGRYRVDPTRVFLFGFSQGGMLTYDIGLLYPQFFRGLLPAGGLPGVDPESLPLERAGALPPIRALHGVYDDVVEFKADSIGVDSLVRRGVRAELLRYPVRHQLSNEMYEDARDFIWRELHRDSALPLPALVASLEGRPAEERAALSRKVLVCTEPKTEVGAALVGLFRRDSAAAVRSEVVYLLGALRSTDAETLLTRVLSSRAEPAGLRQAAYSALTKLGTEAAWKTVGRTPVEVVAIEVMPGSNGEKSGLLAGDVIQSYQGRAVRTNAELRAATNAVKPGTKAVSMAVRREGKVVKLTLAPGRIGVRVEERVK